MSDAKLNLLALARRDKAFMKCIVPHEDNMFVGMDLTAGEPTATAHYSKDTVYRYATVDGVGKEPYWNSDGTLMLDDIYLLTMSRSPIGAAKMKAAWERDWNGKTFAQQWLEKPKVIKSYLDEDRQLHKMLCLALGYGMGWQKMQKQTYEQFSVRLSEQQCKAFKDVYWSIFHELKAFIKLCELKAKKYGYIYNDFGYRLSFVVGNQGGLYDSTHKAFNYLIQSTISGVIHAFIKFLFQECERAGFTVGALTGKCVRLVCVIHDEVVVEVAKEYLELFEGCKERAVLQLNDYVRWSVPVRVGFSAGDTFYDIKG